MISTLRKIPWFMADYITIKQRHSIYDATTKMIEALMMKINRLERMPEKERGKSTEFGRLTPQLLNRLVVSAMLCSGFSVMQKANIAANANMPPEQTFDFNQPRFPHSWRHQWTLVPRAGLPMDVLEVRSTNPTLKSLPSPTTGKFW
jgi:hypothetical protein